MGEHLFKLGQCLIDLLWRASTLVTQGAQLGALDKRQSTLVARLGA